MKEKNEEILELSDEILKNIELSELPLSNVVLKCSRLARLTNNQQGMDWFNYELAGYPKDKEGYIESEAFKLARYGNRTFQGTNAQGKPQEVMFPETVAELESDLEAAKEQLKVAFDPSTSLSSSNPNQFLALPAKNSAERRGLRQVIANNSKKIDQLKVAYYRYVLGVNYELKFGVICEDIFLRRRGLVDKELAVKLPETVKKLVSVYENLRSGNKEDWANAVHSCRRILADVADSLYPPSDIILDIGNGKKIKLDAEHYVVRLKEYVKSKTKSARFTEIVGSHLEYIGDRLDSIYNASNKGSHACVSKEEAERYVIYTYLLLSDLLSL